MYHYLYIYTSFVYTYNTYTQIHAYVYILHQTHTPTHTNTHCMHRATSQVEWTHMERTHTPKTHTYIWYAQGYLTSGSGDEGLHRVLLLLTSRVLLLLTSPQTQGQHLCALSLQDRVDDELR